MKSESEIAELTTKVQRTVDELVGVGAPSYPTTPLEKHAYEMGRLSVLKWLNPPPPEPVECGGVATE